MKDRRRRSMGSIEQKERELMQDRVVGLFSSLHDVTHKQAGDNAGR